MGIVKRILGDAEETPTKTELETIRSVNERVISESIDRRSEPVRKIEEPAEVEESTAVDELIPSGIEMFVRINDYKKIVSNLKRMDDILQTMEELERMHSQLQEIHDKFIDRLESTIADVEELKEELNESLSPKRE